MIKLKQLVPVLFQNDHFLSWKQEITPRMSCDMCNCAYIIAYNGIDYVQCDYKAKSQCNGNIKNIYFAIWCSSICFKLIIFCYGTGPIVSSWQFSYYWWSLYYEKSKYYELYMVIKLNPKWQFLNMFYVSNWSIFGIECILTDDFVKTIILLNL